jgi:hypothetical protein
MGDVRDVAKALSMRETGLFLLLASYVSISINSRTSLVWVISLYFTWGNWWAGLDLGRMIRGLFDHFTNAALAAATASSTSCGVETGTSKFGVFRLHLRLSPPNAEIKPWIT